MLWESMLGAHGSTGKIAPQIIPFLLLLKLLFLRGWSSIEILRGFAPTLREEGEELRKFEKNGEVGEWRREQRWVIIFGRKWDWFLWLSVNWVVKNCSLKATTTRIGSCAVKKNPENDFWALKLEFQRKN